MQNLSGEALLAIEWLLIAIALFLIIARISLRFNHLQLSFKPSDFCILGSFAAGLIVVALDVVQYKHGLFEEYIDFNLQQWVPESDEQATTVLKTLYGQYISFFVLTYLSKGSLVALYYEIFGQHAGTPKTLLHCLSVFVIAGFISTMLVVMTHCHWGCYWSLTNFCSNECLVVNDNLAWSFHFLCDIGIFVFPLFFINRLNMSFAQKISACLTFAFGFMNLSITLARWFVVLAPFTPTSRLTRGVALTVSDGLSGLIIAILPTLRPYLRMWRGNREGLASKLTKSFLGKDSNKTASEHTSSTS